MGKLRMRPKTCPFRLSLWAGTKCTQSTGGSLPHPRCRPPPTRARTGTRTVCRSCYVSLWSSCVFLMIFALSGLDHWPSYPPLSAPVRARASSHKHGDFVNKIDCEMGCTKIKLIHRSFSCFIRCFISWNNCYLVQLQHVNLLKFDCWIWHILPVS